MGNKKKRIILGSILFIGMCVAAIKMDLVQIVHAKVEDAMTNTKVINFSQDNLNSVSRAAVSPDLTHMAFCKGTKEFFVQELSTGTITPYPTEENIYQLKYSPNSTYLVAGRNVLNTKTGKVTQLATDVKFPSFSDYIAFSPDSEELALVNQEQVQRPRPTMIEIWNLQKEKLVQKLPCGFVVSEITFSQDGCNLAVAGDKIIIWDVPKGKPIKIMMTDSMPADNKLESHINYKAIAYSPDGTHLAAVLQSTYSKDKKSDIDQPGQTEAIEIWDTEKGVVVKTFELDSLHNMKKLQYSPDGQHIAIGSAPEIERDKSRDAVWIWDVNQGKVVRKLTQFPDGSVTSMAYSADGNYFSASGRMNTKIWKTK